MFPAIHTLQEVERELAWHKRFASPHQILSSVATFYNQSLGLLRAGSKTTKSKFDDLDSDTFLRALKSPAFRHLLSECVVRSTEGKPLSASTVESLERVLFRLSQVEDDRDVRRLSVAGVQVGVFSPDRDESEEGRVYRDLFCSHISTSVAASPATLVALGSAEFETFELGISQIEQTSFEIAQSVCAHVGWIGFIDYAEAKLRVGQVRLDMCQNVSAHSVPASIFISPSPLRSGGQVAEALIHEAVHKKLSDLVLVRDVFRQGYRLDDARSVRALWNRSLSWNDNLWTTDRALFAFHVYVYLAAVHALAFHRLSKDTTTSFIGAVRRARYLGEALSTELTDDLGQFGRELVHWLMEVLATLSSSVPKQSIRANLLMDRYDRETVEIVAAFRSAGDLDLYEGDWAVDAPYTNWPIRRTLVHLLHAEWVGLSRVLFAIGEGEPASLPKYDGDRWSAELLEQLPFEDLLNSILYARRYTSSLVRCQSDDVLAKEAITSRRRSAISLIEDLVDHAYRHLPDVKLKVADLSRQHVA